MLAQTGTAHSDTELIRAAAVMRAVELMRAEPARPHQLRHLARAGRYSPFHFHRIFREVTRLTPAVYLAAVRMAHARRLLVQTNLTVGQVSREVAYQSLGAFTNQFGRLAGVSPLRFRNLMGTMRQVTVGAVVPAQGGIPLDQHPGHPAGEPGRQPTVTLIGSIPGPSLVMAGLMPAGSLGTGPRWRMFPTGVTPLWLPAPPRDGAYSAFVVVVPAYACLVDTFVDHTPGSYLIGTADVRYPAGVEHIEVELRQPRRTDPPVLATAPVRWLAQQAAELTTTLPASSRSLAYEPGGVRHTAAAQARALEQLAHRPYECLVCGR
jgi:AraC family transcriptional regulator